MEKYSRLRDLVGSQAGIELVEAPSATDTQILYAHDPSYLIKVIEGTLSAQEQREIGFPWSTQMVERSRRSAGATVAAAKTADGAGHARYRQGGSRLGNRRAGKGERTTVGIADEYGVAARGATREVFGGGREAAWP